MQLQRSDKNLFPILHNAADFTFRLFDNHMLMVNVIFLCVNILSQSPNKRDYIYYVLEFNHEVVKGKKNRSLV